MLYGTQNSSSQSWASEDVVMRTWVEMEMMIWDIFVEYEGEVYESISKVKVPTSVLANN